MQSRVNFIELSGKFWPVECLGLNEDEKSTGGERKYLTSLRLTCLRLTEVGEAFERTSVTPFHLALPDRPYAKQFNNFQKNFLIKRQTVRRVRWKLQVIYWIYICLIIKETRVINWTSDFGGIFVHWSNLGIFFMYRGQDGMYRLYKGAGWTGVALR